MFSVILCGYSMIFVLCILCKIIDLNKKFSIMFCCLFISFPKHSNNYFHLFQLINMVSICSFQAEKFEIQTNQNLLFFIKDVFFSDGTFIYTLLLYNQQINQHWNDRIQWNYNRLSYIINTVWCLLSIKVMIQSKLLNNVLTQKNADKKYLRFFYWIPTIVHQEKTDINFENPNFINTLVILLHSRIGHTINNWIPSRIHVTNSKWNSKQGKP